MKKSEMKMNYKNSMTMTRRLAACCLLLFALAGSTFAQGNDKLFVIKRTKYDSSVGDHYLAHVKVGDNWVLQDATEFSPNCLWYSGREFNLMGTNHNYYFIDDENEVRFLMAPLVSGGSLSLSDSKPPVYLLNNTDHNYYFYDWDYDNRPYGAGLARGHQYNGILNVNQCNECEGGRWRDGECWAVYWVECDGSSWQLSTESQYDITANSGRFRVVTDTQFALQVVSPDDGGLADLDDIVMEFEDSETLSATIVPFSYIPAYHKYEFNEVTNPVGPTITPHIYYYPYGSSNLYPPTSAQAVSSGSEPSQWNWSISGEGAEYLTLTDGNTATPTLTYNTENNDGQKTATLTLTVTYQDGSTQTKTATVTVKTPCQNPAFSANVTYEGVIVSWTPTAESYTVSWKKTDASEWYSHQVNNGDVTSDTITGLEYETTYHYKVQASCDPTPATSEQFTTLNQPKAVIGGAVFGGGRMADVGGKTEVVIINTDSIGAVYGGNDIAGSVLGGSDGTEGSTIILGVEAGTTYSISYNNRNASSKVRVGDVYGGGNGYYLYNANEFVGATNPSVTLPDNASVNDLDGNIVWKNETGDDYTLTIPKIVKTAITVNTNVVKVDSIFGGAKNAFITNTAADDGTSITVNGGTVFAVFGGNNYGGNQTAGKHNIAITNTKTNTNAYPTGLGRNYGIGYVFGGGNKVHGLTTDITITGGMCDTVFAGGNAADVTEAEVLFNCTRAKTFTNAVSSWSEDDNINEINDSYEWNGTGIYNVRTLFGGNNRADMSGLPTLTLTRGSIGTVYGGGNAGDMLAQMPDDVDPTTNPGTGPLAVDFDPPMVGDERKPIFYSTHVIVEEANMLVDYLYGGCQMSNVLYSTWTEIMDGHVGVVYGGCNISGDVGSTPRIPYPDYSTDEEYQLVNGGTYVKASGGTIYKNLFAGSNGYYHCNNGLEYIDGVIDLGHYIGDTIPTHNETHVMVSGDVTVKGNVYAGGNMAFVGFINETDQNYKYRDFVGFCSVRMTGGTVEGNVYGGGNRASIFGSNEVKVSGGNIGYDSEGNLKGGALYGGNDRAGQVAQITNRVLPSIYDVASDQETSLKLLGVKTYVGITGKPLVNTVYGGGNGAYEYTPEEYCDITDQPVQSNTFVDVNIDADGGSGTGGYINEVYGGGNGVTVLDRITVFVNVENMSEEQAYDHVGTIFGGNNLGDLDILSDIILLNGQVNTIYGGCNKGAMNGSLPYNGYNNLGSMVHLRNVYTPNGTGTPVSTNGKVTGYVYGGCRMNGVDHNTLVLVEGGEHTATFFGGSDISGIVGDTSQVVVTGGIVGTVYGGGNGNYDYNSTYLGYEPPYCDSTSVEMRGGECTGSIFAGGYAGECGDTYLLVGGGTVDGSIYGGGNRAGIVIESYTLPNPEDPDHPITVYTSSGNSSVEITGGTVLSGVYGGCNALGDIEGDVTINITCGQIGTDDTHTADVHGGGYGEATNVNGNIGITFGEVAYDGGEEVHTECPKLFGDLYGGSAFGNVNTNSLDNPTVPTTTTIQIDNGTLHGNIYGGGLGDPINNVEAMVYGVVQVNVGGINDEGVYYGKASFKGRPIDGVNKGSCIFGGNNLNGTPVTFVHVDVYQTNHTEKDTYTYINYDDREYAIYQVFGGGNKSNYAYTEDSQAESFVHIHGCENTIEWVFGGSNAAHSISASTIVDGGRFDYIFGGGNGIVSMANVGFNEGEGHTFSQVKGGHVGWCFGGSNRLGNCISIEQDLVSGGDCGDLVIEFLFQGGNMADQYGELVLNFTCEENERYIAAYGGCRLGSIYGNITINVTGGTIGSLFGGCQGDDDYPANVRRCPTLEELSAPGANYSEELIQFLQMNPHWYGQGGNITVIVKGGAIGNLYGGCDQNGNVDGKIIVIVESEENNCGLFIGNVYGASNHTAYTPEDPTLVSPRVNIIKATIGGSYDGFNDQSGIQSDEIFVGNVFGGGNEGDVTCNPTVNIGDGSTTKEVVVLGSVYGGGNKGDVNGNAQVFVVPDTHTLTVNPPQIGNVTPAQTGGGIVIVGTHQCSTTSSEDIPVGEGVDISITAIPAQATPAGGYLFDSWTVSGTEASVGKATLSNTTFTMGTDDATLTASFNSVPAHKLTLVADPTAGGTFEVNINGVLYTTGTEFWVAEGATVSIEAVPATGYAFKNWTLVSGTGSSISSHELITTQFTMGTEDAVLKAAFEIPGRRNNNRNSRR
jgi:hypothetical protein